MTNTRRSLTLQVRAESASPSGEVEATVTVYDRAYELAPGLSEVIAAGAFDASIADRSLPVYHEHSWRNGAAPIGVTTDHESNDEGLTIRAQLFVDDDPIARNVHRAMKAKALRQWSIGFTPDEEGVEWEETREGELATVTRGELHEVSTVLRGANPGTTTDQVRALVRAADPDAAAEELRARFAQERDELDDAIGVDLDLSRPEHRELVRARLGASV